MSGQLGHPDVIIDGPVSNVAVTGKVARRVLTAYGNRASS